MNGELYALIETLRAELYLAAARHGADMRRGRVLEISSELDKYLVLAVRELSGLA